jgi:hypothetical protein
MASTRAPSEGEFFDEEVLAAAGLKIVDEPRTSGGSKEEQLLLAINDNFQKLQALHRGRNHQRQGSFACRFFIQKPKFFEENSPTTKNLLLSSVT